MTGRFAPSPTGDLHVGNLRTALVAWLAARSRRGIFLVRMEDLDRVTSSAEHERRQLDDLAALGLTHDGDVIRQSERFALYHQAIDHLTDLGLTYPCWCSRREVREAAAAPHVLTGHYPGTCRGLDPQALADRASTGRRPAVRLDAVAAARHLGMGELVEIHDVIAGRYQTVVDDLVLRRNDGVPAYHVSVVVDDAAQGVTEVVRGDDLLAVTPSHVLLQRLLGAPTPRYAHVPLAVTPDGERLAKRHGAVTLADLAQRGVGPHDVLRRLVSSLGITMPPGPIDVWGLAERFDLSALGRDRRPWVIRDL
jgi:glutamyl-tRNA synthetase